MEIIPNDSSLFRAAMDGLKEFLPQIQLRISSDGIRIHGMDVSHVGFVEYYLAKEDCAVLTVPAPIVIGINTNLLAKSLSSVSSGDRVTLGLKNDTFLVSYKNEKMSKKSVYEIGTLDITEETMHLPDLTYNATITCKTADMHGMIKEVSHFGDSMKLRLDEEGFHVSAIGDGGNVFQSLENTDDRDMSLQEDSVEANFGTKYLLTIMKSGSPLSSSTKLEFDGMQPLRATFLFGKASRFVSYLAPKIQDM